VRISAPHSRGVAVEPLPRGLKVLACPPRTQTSIGGLVQRRSIQASCDSCFTGRIAKGGLRKAVHKVYEGCKLRTGQLVAVKVTGESGMSEAFFQKGFNHPNVMSLVDSWTSPFCSILVSPLATTTLDQHMRDNNGSLSTTQSLHLCEQMAAAVAYLHRLEVLHRDLHHGNVLLTRLLPTAASGGVSPSKVPTSGRSVRVQLADFGLCCTKPPLDRLVVLPIQFRPPEILFGNGSAICTDADAKFKYKACYRAPSTRRFDHTDPEPSALPITRAPVSHRLPAHPPHQSRLAMIIAHPPPTHPPSLPKLAKSWGLLRSCSGQLVRNLHRHT
jgi:serine/threonine protein kinase